MKLYDEEELRKKNEKSKKIKNLILVSIIFTVVLIVLIIGAIYYLIYNPNKITINLNGKENEKIENIIITRTADDDGSTLVYFPIRQFASQFGYNSNNGDYGTNVENIDNCYIESENEVAIFTENSNVIYKIDKTAQNNSGDTEYEEVHVDYPVIRENDVLYVDTEGLSKSFNLNININKKMKKINITTLDVLVTSATKTITDNKYGKLDEKFANQKAILDNMMVIESDFDGQKGVRNFSTKEEILGFQYDDITYIPSKEAFLVEKDSKVGIVGSDKIVKIKPQYDNLTLIDSINGLYLAEDNGFFGVIDENGNTKIYLEHSKIGVDFNEFKENGLKNGYILLGNLIPVLDNGIWGFYKIESTKNADGSRNVQCTKLQTDEFSGIGCRTRITRGTVTNLMLIEEYGMIIVQKQGRYYGFMNQNGVLPIGVAFTDIYAETTSGQKNYFMVYYKDGKTYNATQALEKAGYSKVNNK